MSMEFYTYGNGEMLTSLFQAIAALTKTSDYLKLLQLIFILNIPVVLLEIIFTGRFKATARLFIILLIVNGAVLPKVTIDLVDRVDSSNDTTIADVPVGLGVPLAYASALGDWAASAFETTFALPNSLRYKNNGLLFASRLVESSTHFEITTSRMSKNMSEFSKGCIYYGILVGWFTMDTITDATNIWSAIPAASFGNAIYVDYDNGTNTNLLGCRTVRNKLEVDWTNELTAMEKQYGQRLFPNAADAASAKTLLVSALPQAYTFMTNIGLTASNLIRQNAMINALRRSFNGVAGEAGATAAAQDFALAQAEAQQRTTYSTLGAMAGRTLPLMSNVLETLIYGIFPVAVVFIILSLTQGKAIFTYFKLLVWLQLWPPLYAILNYAMTTYGASLSTAAATLPSGTTALTMMTYSGISAANSDMAAMAGILTWMVPMFSWAIVSGSGFAASQMAASLGSVAQSAGSTAAGQVATGNLSLGNVGYGNTQLKNFTGQNTSMFKTDMNPTLNKGVGSSTNPMTGMTTLQTAGGMRFGQQPVTSMPFSAAMSSGIKSGVTTTAGHKTEAALNDAQSLGATTAASYGNMTRLANMTDKSTSVTDGADRGVGAQFKNSLSNLNKILDGFDFGQNMSRAQKAAAMAKASMGLMVGGNGANAGINLEGQSMSGTKWASMMKYAKESGFQKAWDATQQSGEKLSTQLSQRSGDSLGKDISAGFNEQRAASKQLSSSLSDAQTWQQMATRMQESGASGSMNAVAAAIQIGNRMFAGNGQPNMEQLAAQASSLNGNSAAATAELNRRLAAVTQSPEFLAAANVGAAPDSSNVNAAHTANQAAVLKATEQPSDMQAPGSGNIKAFAAGTVDTVNQMAGDRGIPNTQDIQQQGQSLRAEVSGNISQTNGKIATGETGISERGATIEKPVADAVEPENQNHMGAAAVEMGGNIASTGINSVTGMKDAVSDTVDQMFNGNSSQSSGGVVGGSGDPNYPDLPPMDEIGGKAETGLKSKGAWANRLD